MRACRAGATFAIALAALLLCASRLPRDTRSDATHSESLPTDSCQDFCLALKAARERKGITLAEIAETTKIPSSVFAALERCDLRCWPKGLFRRSFFRDYAGMIGLPVAEAVEAFVRLFPDDEPAIVSKVADEVPRRSIFDALTLPPAIAAAWRRAAAVMSHLFGSSDEVETESTDEPEPRAWVSDARRVGPPPRIRVRIKVSR